MMRPLDGVGEALRVGDRVTFEPPRRLVVGRIVEIEPPSGIVSGIQQGQAGRVRIQVEIDHLYVVAGGHAQPLDAVFKLAAPASEPGLQSLN